MKKFNAVVAVSLLFMLSVVSDTYAIAGIGAHYGLDFSMGMKDVKEDGLKIPGSGFNMEIIPQFNLPDGVEDGVLRPSTDDANFLYASRTDFKNSFINLGGKVYVDIIPFINTFELSCNFGLWQYEGAVHYLDVKALEKKTPEDWSNPDEYPYKTQKMTLEEFNMSYLGLSGTPYAKLQLDASIRKDVFKLPLDIFKVNAGAGFTVNFTTPVLGSHLVEGVQTEEGLSPEEMVNQFTNSGSKIGKQIVEKILKELFTPRYGMHIVAGAGVKIPAVPIGFYADGKLMIPFSKFDENGDITGLGFLLNFGVAFQL